MITNASVPPVEAKTDGKTAGKEKTAKKEK